MDDILLRWRLAIARFADVEPTLSEKDYLIIDNYIKKVKGEFVMSKSDMNELYRMLYTQPKEDLTYMLMGALDKINKVTMLCDSALDDFKKDDLEIYNFVEVVDTIKQVITRE